MSGLPGITSRQAIQQAPAAVAPTDLIAIVGTGTDGRLNSPLRVSGSSNAIATVGADTTTNSSLLYDYLRVVPEGNDAIFVRVADATARAATITVTDASGGVTGSFIAQGVGTNADLGSALYALRSGTLTVSPVLRVSLSYPGYATGVFDNLVAYAQPGGSYDAPTFQANLAAAVNGAAKNVVRSKTWVYSTGPSTVAPQIGVAFGALGGVNGDAGVGSQQLIGTSGDANTRSGIYALAGSGFDFLFLAGNSDPTIIQTALAFVASEGAGLLVYSFPQGSTPTQMASIKAANGLTAARLITAGFWNLAYDSYQGQQVWVAPAGKVAGIYASLDAADDGLNKPTGGAVGIVATEGTYDQQLSIADQQTLFSNNIVTLLDPSLQGEGIKALSTGLASDGSSVADTRMSDRVALACKRTLGQYLGGRQTVPLLDRPDTTPDTDKFRGKVSDAMNAIVQGFILRGELSSGGCVCDLTNNIRSTVIAKQLFVLVYGTTLAGVYFGNLLTMVGDQVTIAPA